MTNPIHSLSTLGNVVSQQGHGRQAVAGEAWQQGHKEGVHARAKPEMVVEPSVSKLSQAVDGLNDALEIVTTHLRFRLHEDTHRYYVEIVNTALDEVIREVPPKRFLDMVADMYQFMGMIVDERR